MTMSRTTLECHLKIVIYIESRGRLGWGKLDALKTDQMRGQEYCLRTIMIVSECSPSGFFFQQWRVLSQPWESLKYSDTGVRSKFIYKEIYNSLELFRAENL